LAIQIRRGMSAPASVRSVKRMIIQDGRFQHLHQNRYSFESLSGNYPGCSGDHRDKSLRRRASNHPNVSVTGSWSVFHPLTPSGRAGHRSYTAGRLSPEVIEDKLGKRVVHPRGRSENFSGGIRGKNVAIRVPDWTYPVAWAGALSAVVRLS